MNVSENDKLRIISILDESITVILWYNVSCVYDMRLVRVQNLV